MRRVVERIASRFVGVQLCYEACPTGYGLYRLILLLGLEYATLMRGIRRSGED
ncbi:MULTISPECIES: hypothetical protein [Bradyrhizobium]|uniref:hypothetical protein n=1 Tax=Bradyrhizobium TaxID=374 RepID=UPI0015A14741|nr:MULTISPECIES: hypothetical protein [Bradyrhizobium]MCA6103887.1 hypothetical protein [Bradyrhizobium australafricanum]MCC8970130.1 hypothetical protein [Bradyrhizobium brasilense]